MAFKSIDEANLPGYDQISSPAEAVLLFTIATLVVVIVILSKQKLGLEIVDKYGKVDPEREMLSKAKNIF